MRLLSLLFVSFFLMIAGISAHAATLSGASVTAAASGGERVTFAVDGQVKHKRILVLDKPDRLAIDFPAIKAKSLSVSGIRPEGLVRQVRFGQFDKDTSRVVLDLQRPAGIRASFAQQDTRGNWGYVVEIEPRSATVGSRVMEAPKAAPQAAAPQKSTLDTVFDQVQDEKPLIVIDPGHGGKDPGTTGLHSTREKQITLEIAKALRTAFLRTGRYRVALTREDDRFILLPERVNIARRLKADAFISLHADSNPNKTARGFSIYTVSEEASDAETAALAERENAVDDLSGLNMKDVDKDVADILLDLATRETREKSSRKADLILEALHPKVTKLPRPHRYAGFRVLKAPDVPSVLIELGFLTNTEDERLLLSREYRDLVTQSVVRGLDAYYVTVKRR
jgi:N-acetylmuramoyl-L-alanine amidase